jgi:hypothetical protein
VIVTVTANVMKRCPYKQERDYGTATLTFDVPLGEDAPELHALAEYLNGFTEQAISHEAFTSAVRRDWPVMEVKSTWTTAGLSVEVVDRRV